MAKDIEKLQEIAEEFEEYYYHLNDEDTYDDEEDDDEDSYDDEEDELLSRQDYDFNGIESVQQLIDKHADYFKLNNPLEAVDTLYEFSNHFNNDDSYCAHFIKEAINERIFSILMSNPTQEILNKLEKTELSEENEFKVAKFNQNPTNKAIETLIKPLIHEISNKYGHPADKASHADELLQNLQNDFFNTVVIECEPIRNFYRAEEEHQEYLLKNPTG